MSADRRYDESYYDENRQDEDRIALWFYERIARRLAPGGSTALDYGSGTGWFARRLSRSFETHAFDISEHARELTSLNAPDVRVHDSTDSLSRIDFDMVTALHVLEHLPMPAEALDLVYDLLRPDGRLLVVVPNPDGLGHRIQQEGWFAYRDPTHCSLLPMRNWFELITESGFRIDRAGTDGLWDFPYAIPLPKVLQFPILAPLAGIQVLIGRLLFPPTWGECLVVTATKPSGASDT